MSEDFEEAVSQDRVIWTLRQGIKLVRKLQPALHARHYHVALGGGVLNKGWSVKDLDLYFMPFDQDEPVRDILPFLEEQFGPSQPIGQTEYARNTPSAYAQKVKFLEYAGGRIDAFIVGPRE